MAAGDALLRTQRMRVEDATDAFELLTGVPVSVYLGQVDGPVGDFAAVTLADLIVGSPDLLLIVVEPSQRQVEIRSSPSVHLRLSDQACALAALSMTTSFGVGDLVGGLVVGLRMLADAVAPPLDHFGRPAPTSSMSTPADLTPTSPPD